MWSHCGLYVERVPKNKTKHLTLHYVFFFPAQHYFQNWDYTDSPSILLEKEAERKFIEQHAEDNTLHTIRSDLSKSIGRVKSGFQRRREIVLSTKDALLDL